MNLRNVGIITAATFGVIGISWATNRVLNSEWVSGVDEPATEAKTEVQKETTETKEKVKVEADKTK